jgi:predicted Zn finger-like uncharacterized protein
VHVACPQCGTAYRLDDARTRRARLRLRCRRCSYVWEAQAGEEAEPASLAAHDHGDEDITVASAPDEDTLAGRAPAPPPPAAPPAAKGPRPTTRRLAAALYALAGLVVLVSGGGLAWAYRDTLPFAAAPAPALSRVEPAWTDGEDGPRLVISAAVENRRAAAVQVDRLRVTFFDDAGLRLDDTVVEVPTLTVPGGGTATLEMAVDRLPADAASFELRIVGPRPGS